MMKRSIAGILVLFLAAQVWAGEGKWLTSLPEAQARAKKEGKMILMDFTGSDWCPPCKALYKNVLSSKDFKAFAQDSLILVELDFPARKQQSAELKKANKKLKEQFKIKGFPTVVVLDKDGNKVFEQVGYGGDAKGYLAKLKKALKK